MKIHYYEYTDDGENWREGAASFDSLEILQLAEKQPYKYIVHTIEFDSFYFNSFYATTWREEKIALHLKEAMGVEILKTFEGT